MIYLYHIFHCFEKFAQLLIHKWANKYIKRRTNFNKNIFKKYLYCHYFNQWSILLIMYLYRLKNFQFKKIKHHC